MNQINDGSGPAFPNVDISNTCGEHGMSLRDWFAGMAVQGMLASGRWDHKESAEQFAGLCFRIADAMIAQQRTQPNPKDTQ